MRDSDPTLVVGIDEAGYGPILGPLVVSASAFEMPCDRSDACLWRILRGSVCQKKAASDGRIAILDSKKLYHRKEGLARLERSVLAVLAVWRRSPTAYRELLDMLCPEALGNLDQYPWYGAADPTLPRCADAGGIRIAAGMLQRDALANSVRIAGCWSEVLPEGHYNRLVGRTRNKAVVLFGMILRLIQRVAEAHPGHELRIVVDKQGARSHYGSLLMRAFEGRHLRVLEEGDDHSAYEMVTERSRWRVGFTQSGESKHLPVALASMVSKYVREILMECFNNYWARQVPGVRSTAGYYQDGVRFLKEIRPHMRRLGIGDDVLIRQRSGVAE